ncbi:hypothetical protein K438DRAFT_1780216 [Mycena galopus ATCC 62051]|nr:hypothetical protein K438DRAFT_1780216 [Mycena galopus ATCC 62051]
MRKLLQLFILADRFNPRFFRDISIVTIRGIRSREEHSGRERFHFQLHIPVRGILLLIPGASVVLAIRGFCCGRLWLEESICFLRPTRSANACVIFSFSVDRISGDERFVKTFWAQMTCRSSTSSPLVDSFCNRQRLPALGVPAPPGALTLSSTTSNSLTKNILGADPEFNFITVDPHVLVNSPVLVVQTTIPLDFAAICPGFDGIQSTYHNPHPHLVTGWVRLLPRIHCVDATTISGVEPTAVSPYSPDPAPDDRKHVVTFTLSSTTANYFATIIVLGTFTKNWVPTLRSLIGPPS